MDKFSKSVKELFSYLHSSVTSLNNSKLFAGLMIIILNIASKFVTFKLSKSMESYLKFTFSKQVLVFAMAWMGTRDIYIALFMTVLFTIFMEYLFNEESACCVVPHKYRVLHKLIDKNKDGNVDETEINSAIAILEKAKREEQKKRQKDLLLKMDFYRYDYDSNNL